LSASGFAIVDVVSIDCGTDVASLIVAEAGAVAPSLGVSLRRTASAADARSIAILDHKGALESELVAALTRNLLAIGRDAQRPTDASDKVNADIVVHFPPTAESPLGSMELLSARCLGIKAAAERVSKKGAAVWFVFCGALSHGSAKVRPVETGAWAFARTVANEFQNLDIRRIDVLPHVPPSVAAARIEDIILSGTDETELQIDATTIRAVRVGSIRGGMDETRSTPAPAARLVRQTGSSQRLQWQPADRVAPAAGEVEIEVAATGLNFRDLMWMLSLLPEDILEDGFSGATLGLECAGRVVRVGPEVTTVSIGDRVAALTGSAFSTHVTIPAKHAVKVPENISPEGAATIPVAFFTAYYSLIRLARLKRDEWVLIHGGAGGVGMAAIQVAQARGARIIATAGSKAKRDLLTALGVAHVFDSRSNSFADQVRKVTGEGVDVVLNSLAGEAMERSLSCLRPFGRFVELGKRDYVNNSHMGLRPFSKNLSYFGVDLDQLTVNRPDICEKIYSEVGHQFATGAFKPLPHSVFSAANVADAFHLMQQSSHVGKIVVHPPAPDSVRLAARPFEFNPNGTHVITGAFGGFGLETAKWLVEKGVRHLVMVGRNGPNSEVAKRLLKDLNRQGVIVLAEACDVSDAPALELLFKKVRQSMPPVAGVIHAAMVLDDMILANLDAERLNRVLAPKVKGAENLDQLTRDLNLEYFVLFSTLVTLIGNAGQGNYVAANAFMEGLARRRRQDGLPALAIGWGPIADVGVLVRKQLLESSIQKLAGVRGLTAREGLELMAEALSQTGDDINLAVVTIAPNSGGFGGSHLPVLRSPTYTALAQVSSGQSEGGIVKVDVASLLKTDPLDKVRKVIMDGIVAQLAGVMHSRPENISRVRPLGEIGLDSLMALELGMNIEAMFGAHVSLVGVAGNRSIAELANEIIAQSGSERIDAAGAAEAIVERHAGKVDRTQLEAVKEVLREQAPLMDGLAS
jgi:NADPH:quinone reductase-like Zn-dependent oxidoreductase/acyl carrier protein